MTTSLLVLIRKVFLAKIMILINLNFMIQISVGNKNVKMNSIYLRQ